MLVKNQTQNHSLSMKSTIKQHQRSDETDLALEMDSDLLIPVLDEQILEKDILAKVESLLKKHQEVEQKIEEVQESQASTEHSQDSRHANKANKNPFLPYEHLEQLAEERQRFRQELESFTQDLKSRHEQQRHTAQQLPSWAAQIKSEILDELRPLIRNEVQSAVAEQLTEILAKKSYF